MNNYLTKNYMDFKTAAKKDWYITSIAQKPHCKVKIELEDGKSKLYRSHNSVNIGDVAVIGSDCKTSFAMGEVTDNTNTGGGKSKLAPAIYVFSEKPSLDEIKKAASKIDDFSGITGIKKHYKIDNDVFDFIFVFGELQIEYVLFAISVLAHRDMASAAQIKKATTYLESAKEVCPDFFGDEMGNILSKRWNPASTVVLAGFYDGWETKIKNLPFWNNKTLQDVDVSFTKSDYGDCYGIVVPDCSDDIKKAFAGAEELHKAYTELVFRSALSIIIRGGFVNLLKAALNVAMPIKDCYDDLCDFAKEIGSDFCYKVLIAEKNKVLSAKPSKSGTKKGKPAVVASEDFYIEGTTLISYKGNEEEVIIPEGIKTIGERAFEKKPIKKIVLAESVTQIKDYAFSECDSLSQVIFNQKLKTLHHFIFWRCDSLIEADLSNTSLEKMKHNVFRDCQNLHDVYLPNTLKEIEGIGLQPEILHCYKNSVADQWVKERNEYYGHGKIKKDIIVEYLD